jgi:cardiolipin synthase
VFRPLKFAWSQRVPQLRRMHRKLAVIDGSTAFVGGINIIDDLSDLGSMAGELPPRLDYAVQVHGPLVADIALSARRLWAYAALTWLKRPWDWPTAPPPPAPAGTMRAALAVRDNLRRRHLIQSAYLTAIYRAREDIILSHAYFLPGQRLLRALCQASARGVRVRLLLQGRPDHPLLHYATLSLYETLLKAGIELYEYRATHLHTKVAAVDSHWATVGSSNIDPFSLLLAREANVVIESPAFCASLRGSLEAEIAAGGVRLSRDFARSRLERLKIRISYAIVRLLASSVGFRI